MALLAGLLGLPIVVRAMHELQLPFPRCALRTFTGIPCPACGSTRSLMAWTDLDPLAALRLNPLFFLLCLAGAAWILQRLTSRFMGWRWPSPIQRWAGSVRNTWIVFALIFLNWVYLCLTLPK